MFVRVAPLFRLPAAKSVFDYEWQSAMMPLIGSCITIPFRGKTAAAIIIDVLEKSDFKTRPITVTTELKLLTPYETLWLEHMAQRFQEPVGMMCERMLPPLLVRTKNSFVRTAAPQTKSRPSLQYAWYKNKDTFFSTLDSITQKNKTPQLVVAHSHAAATEIFKYLTEQKLPVFYFDPTSNPLRRAAWKCASRCSKYKKLYYCGYAKFTLDASQQCALDFCGTNTCGARKLEWRGIRKSYHIGKSRKGIWGGNYFFSSLTRYSRINP